MLLFFDMQTQAGLDESTADFVIAHEIESEGEGRTLIQHQIVMCQPKRVIELLVVVISSRLPRTSLNDWLISTFLVKPRQALAQPAFNQVLFWKIRWMGGAGVKVRLRVSCISGSIETQTAFLEARPSVVLSDHEMIEHADVKQLACLHHCAGDSDIIGRGSWVTDDGWLWHNNDRGGHCG
ncbi:MAG: hypothetical protein V9G24_21760 [Rhodoblastus sp.]